MDSRYAAGRDDISFDMIWYSAGRIDAEGYAIESAHGLARVVHPHPGTVFHAAYGSRYEKTGWDGVENARDRSLREIRRGLFVKASYLWRL